MSPSEFSKDAVSVDQSIVFLLDVDNTLLDNDRLKADLERRIQLLLGGRLAERFWQIYEEVRRDCDYVDYPTTISRLATEQVDPELKSTLDTILDGIQFSSYVYPGAFEALKYLGTLGTTVILSDGDQVFQPHKIRYSGLESAVGGNVLVFVHKENQLPQVFGQYPADHYVAIDDKPRILAALERDCPSTFTTVLVLQGKYAVQGEFTPAPDMVIDRIGALQQFTREQFLAGRQLQPEEPQAGNHQAGSN